MKDSAQVVIIGGGIVGCSVAYHLARLGMTDVLVLEQGPLFKTGGSTSHAPGGVFQTNFSRMMTEFAKYTVQLYAQLSSPDKPAWYPVGGMEVAWTPERLTDLHRKSGVARSWGLEAGVLSAAEARQMIPLLSERILGAYFVPGDGIANAVQAAEAMAKDATGRGVVFQERTEVTAVDIHAGRVRGVETRTRRITGETVLVATGIWGPSTGAMAGVSVPLYPMEHQYAETAPLPELAGETAVVRHPVLRHQDRAMYFRQVGERYGIGSYLHEPLLFESADIPPHGAAKDEPALRPFTPEHFERALDCARELLPALDGVPLERRINGMFSFTPDGMPLLGPSPQIAGLWLAAAVWITHAGGVGKSVAEWMVEGAPEWDLREADLSRFHPHQLARSYVRERSAQQYREVYDVVHPRQQFTSPRNLRISPFYVRQRELEARFFEAGGWERPEWYECNRQQPGEGPPPFPLRQGWEAEEWSPAIGIEHLAVRQRVGLMDLSAFAKLEVTGPRAVAYLESITANRVDRPPGHIIYTSLLTRSGGIKCDLTVMRLAEERFLVVTGGVTGAHDISWMRSHLPAGSGVVLQEVTSSLCCLGVWGPRARRLVQSVTDDDFSNAAFPYLRVRQLTVGGLPALAARISYVGELGWEFYVRPELGLRLWDLLWEAGEGLGVSAVGSGAQDSLRLEKGYRLWGADIHTDYNPFEAGLDFAVWTKGRDFLGRDALLRARRQGSPSRLLCCITLDDPARVVMGKEPIIKDGRTLGYVTSANYGYTVGRGIVYGYLPREFAEPGTAVEVEYFGEGLAATVQREPLYDPDNARLRS